VRSVLKMPSDLISLKGLSETEAARRLRVEGYNELSRAPTRSVIRIALAVCSEPMFELLLAASVIYFALGDIGEALILVGSAITTVVVAIVQESRTERVLEALRDLSSPRALVIRDGTTKRIAGREVVRGDIVLISEGDRVPADAILRESSDLQADESLLTGESVPVDKCITAPCESDRPGFRVSVVFAGTLIVRGHAVGEVFATGSASEIGKIGKALREIVAEPSPLNVQVRGLFRVLAAVGIALSALLFVLYVIMRGSWVKGLLAGITLAMSLLPEEFPLVLTIFLVMGAWRISKAHVLTRRSATIETLGAATVLCSDKTGTLTLNRMSIRELYADGETISVAPGSEQVSERFLPLVEYGVLASESHPFDPMERAFHDMARLLPIENKRKNWTLAHEYELTAQFLAVTHVWKPPQSGLHIVAVKGAPETIMRLCRLPGTEKNHILAQVEYMARRGLRILAIAKGTYPGPPWPNSPSVFELNFLGLVGLADPLRPNVPEAVLECHRAGIRVIMITGDHPVTAQAIASEAGLDVTGGVLSGEELAQMSDAELCERLKSVRVFARTRPEQKLRLVNSLKANGEIVAMTGDGVNDAPSLKAAHIGIAMGNRGTDVAREASALVLLDDNFTTIVKAIRLGRRIYDNLRKAMRFLLAVHIPIAGLSLLPVIFGWPLILTPVHIAFLELVLDPIASIVFEAEADERDIMLRRPRDVNASMFSPSSIGWSIVQGVSVLALTGAIMVEAIWTGVPDSEVRALTFVSLVICNWLLVFVNRSFSSSIVLAFIRPNAALWIVFAITAVLLGISPYCAAGAFSLCLRTDQYCGLHPYCPGRGRHDRAARIIENYSQPALHCDDASRRYLRS
jgi:P-type Ca2+ transporter type 2C